MSLQKDVETSEHLKAAVYGANDGIITTFAVVAGVAGASLSSSIILILGIANMVADGISMGLSNFLGERSQRRFWQSRQEKPALDSSTWHSGLITFFAFNLAGSLPLLPYIFEYLGVPIPNPFYLSIAATATALFVVGSLRTFITKGHWWISGLEMLGIGALAASAAYFIGHLIGQLI